MPMFTARLNTVKQYGVILAKDNYFIFKAYPFSSCPVIEMKDKSKWNLIDTVYNIIKQ